MSKNVDRVDGRITIVVPDGQILGIDAVVGHIRSASETYRAGSQVDAFANETKLLGSGDPAAEQPDEKRECAMPKIR